MRSNTILPSAAGVLTGVVALALAPARDLVGPGAGGHGALTPWQAALFSHLAVVEVPDGQGGLVETLRVSGANLQVVNGLGATNGVPSDPTATGPGSWVANGLGNVIVGYSEADVFVDRTGSHNLVVGFRNEWTAVGGMVLGAKSHAGGAHATITGGFRHRNTGALGSVAGGQDANLTDGCGWSVQTGGTLGTVFSDYTVCAGGTETHADGDFGTVLGGFSGALYDTASTNGVHATVAGGQNGSAGESEATVLGGADGGAWGNNSTVAGGHASKASYTDTLVMGGLRNWASNHNAAVFGGQDNQASGTESTVLGGVSNAATGNNATVIGGNNNVAQGTNATVAGGRENVASGLNAAVGGGQSKEADETYEWYGGGHHTKN